MGRSGSNCELHVCLSGTICLCDSVTPVELKTTESGVASAYGEMEQIVLSGWLLNTSATSSSQVEPEDELTSSVLHSQVQQVARVFDLILVAEDDRQYAPDAPPSWHRWALVLR